MTYRSPFWIVTAALLAAFPMTASAQALTPMKQVVPADTDVFKIGVDVSNPYAQPQRSRIIVRDTAMLPILRVALTADDFVLGPGQKRRIGVLVDFEPGKRTRIVYVCHAMQPRIAGVGASYKGEVCGKVSAFRSR
ncbi:hypothetical protein [uncultured Algimonas sp.]|uniref:hypothetical protein n=1 Tax=uncultured Algimonas sp. TaxID=1547920 RepID=UPI0026253C07|nr:hypothetical protein [uncultured Algimonas sp.]